MKTLKIPFSASQVNMSPNVHLFGTVSMMGLTGFGHAALRLISQSIGHDLVDLGIALVLCEHHYLSGYLKPTWAKMTARERVESGASLQEVRIGSLAGYVVLRFDGADQAIVDFQRKLAQLRFDLAKLRFIGGRFFPDSSGIEFYENDPQGQLAMKGLPYDARVYVDNTPLITQYAACHSVDRLEAMVKLTRLHEASRDISEKEPAKQPTEPEVDQAWIDENDEQVIAQELDALDNEREDDFDYSLLDATEWADASQEDVIAATGWLEQYYGRLVAVDIGYRLLETPVQRPHRFSDKPHYPHAYAEPVLGLARLQSVASCRKQSAPIFWQTRQTELNLVASGHR